MWIRKYSIVRHVLLFAIVFGSVFLLCLRMIVTDQNDMVVPSLEGQPFLQAQEMLQAAKLELKVQKLMYSFNHPKNTVLSQSVAPGEIVSEGRTINLTVSKGLDPLWKKSLVGKSLQQAQDVLRKEMISVFETSYFCADHASEQVLDASFDRVQKKMKLLLESEKCPSQWILKRIGKAEYVQAFTKNAAKHKIQVRRLGQWDDHDKVQTDPPAGSVISNGDYIVVRRPK